MKLTIPITLEVETNVEFTAEYVVENLHRLTESIQRNVNKELFDSTLTVSDVQAGDILIITE